jgi:hypothetical protein
MSCIGGYGPGTVNAYFYVVARASPRPRLSDPRKIKNEKKVGNGLFVSGYIHTRSRQIHGELKFGSIEYLRRYIHIQPSLLHAAGGLNRRAHEALCQKEYRLGCYISYMYQTNVC